MESEQMNEFRPLILVAEDDDSNFKLIKAIIGKKCDIEWAKNGQEMVELFQQHQQRAKAMLMDIKMPVMNGLEVSYCFRFLGSDRWKNCAAPMIAITMTMHSSTSRIRPMSFFIFTVISPDWQGRYAR